MVKSNLIIKTDSRDNALLYTNSIIWKHLKNYFEYRETLNFKLNRTYKLSTF